jgi:hypothetical protein
VERGEWVCEGGYEEITVDLRLEGMREDSDLYAFINACVDGAGRLQRRTGKVRRRKKLRPGRS